MEKYRFALFVPSFSQTSKHKKKLDFIYKKAFIFVRVIYNTGVLRYQFMTESLL